MYKIFTLGLLMSLFLVQCKEADKPAQRTVNPNDKIPRTELYDTTNAEAKVVLNELTARFKNDIDSLAKEVTANGSKIVFAFISPEFGESLTPLNRYGLDVFADYFKAKNYEYYDFTKSGALYDALKKDPKLAVTQMPKDGHWSKQGAMLVEQDLAGIVKKYQSYKNASAAITIDPTKIYGSLEPKQNAVLDGGKDIPYQFVTNAQGFRMDKDIDNPKSRQRFVFFGDSQLFFPFLDNKDSGTGLLQNEFKDVEIINASNWALTISDYLAMYRHGVNQLQPDVVVVGINGSDIADYFFTHRRRFSIEERNFEPSASEKAFYDKFSQK